MAQRCISVDLRDEGATTRLGEDIAAILKSGDVIALRGDLGMGKTTLARAIIRAIAGNRDLEVPSPTFTLVQVYPGRIPIHHFDLYRLGDPDELEELGFAEAMIEGAVLVEWPERAGHLLPADAVMLELSEHEDGRRVSVCAHQSFLERLARSLAIRAFLDAAGFAGSGRSFLVGDASTRAYETVALPGRPPVILMNSPKRPDGPPIRDGKPYSQIAHLAEDVVPFVAVASALRDAGFAAPAILAQDLEAGILVIENLGSDGITVDGRAIRERYVACARLLAAVHAVDWPVDIAVAPGIEHHIPDYDHLAMAIETELLIDWYVPHVLGRAASEAERADFLSVWAALFQHLDTAERSLVLRDYHSPNIIWRMERSGYETIGLIDFQDAMIGPAAYDLASLAMDARVTIDPELEKAVVDAYCTARAGSYFDRSAFDEAYAIMAAQRNSKILGIFVRLNLRDGKPGYMNHLPRIRDYLDRALAHPSLAEMRTLYHRLGVLE